MVGPLHWVFPSMELPHGSQAMPHPPVDEENSSAAGPYRPNSSTACTDHVLPPSEVTATWPDVEPITQSDAEAKDGVKIGEPAPCSIGTGWVAIQVVPPSWVTYRNTARWPSWYAQAGATASWGPKNLGIPRSLADSAFAPGMGGSGRSTCWQRA